MLARPDSSSNPSLLPRGVRRALDAMRENVERDWSVIDLAEAAGLSSRSLQRQFRACLGKSPAVALRDIRFERARRELLQCLPDIRVMDVALRCGFSHFGRFSTEYRRRYGETPSQTRRRQAVFIGALASAPAFHLSGRDRPTIALSTTATDAEHSEVARHIAEELATALARAGVAVVNQPRSARYHLASAMRGTARQTRLNFRLIEAESGRHLWAHRTTARAATTARPTS
jgi:transcriptional regulator GlxA family with amidase domain